MNVKVVQMDFVQYVYKIGGRNHLIVVHINVKMVNKGL